MFRTMRRAKQQLSREAAVEILAKNTGGTLALLGDEDYPYAVPMSYVYFDGKLYFHSADTGHKIDAVARHEKASFCVIDQDRVVPEKYTTHYRSVIAFGRARLVEDAAEKRAIAIALVVAGAVLLVLWSKKKKKAMLVFGIVMAVLGIFGALQAL